MSFTVRFQKLLDKYCKRSQKQPHKVLNRLNKNDPIFLPPVLAFYVASYPSPVLHLEILDYYLYGRLDEIEFVYKKQISLLDQQLAVANLGNVDR